MDKQEVNEKGRDKTKPGKTNDIKQPEVIGEKDKSNYDSKHNGNSSSRS